MTTDQMIATLQKELELTTSKISAIHKQYTTQAELYKKIDLREKALSQQVVSHITDHVKFEFYNYHHHRHSNSFFLSF
jgi:hypothetical protein